MQYRLLANISTMPSGTRQLALILFTSFLALGLASCGGSSDGNNGEGSVDRSTLSEEALVGRWDHDSWSSEPDGMREENTVDTGWTFNGDGTGIYHQMGSESEFEWSLDGEDIKFGDQVAYTVVSYSENEMTWRNHNSPTRDGDYYFVSRR